MKRTEAFWICSILCMLRLTSIRRSCIWPWILSLPKYSESLAFREYLTELTIRNVLFFINQRIVSMGLYITWVIHRLHRILEVAALNIINIKITSKPKNVLRFIWKISCASPDFGKPNTKLNGTLASKNLGPANPYVWIFEAREKFVL